MNTQHDTASARNLAFLADMLADYPAGIDPDFDSELDDFEREFAELRLQFND